MDATSTSSGFIHLVRHHRRSRGWSIAELARRSALTQPEVSRLESGKRTPTLRHVQGLAEAFSATTPKSDDEPQGYEGWVATLVDLGEESRRSARTPRAVITQS